ncbi:fra a 1-associated protein-like [Rutidosis leptorrhynchoides]|uniref:fra a 1-associated protein-like n=1 Tax=Rutidosis leptorrhynchoides TaxID=125765 RepID=UPI003A993D48
MGWVWKDDDDDHTSGEINPRSESVCSTRKIISSQCTTEEVEPGKFIKKCEKTEQLLKDCVGRPPEVVQSNKEYTEEDVTNEMKNASFSTQSSELAPFNFPGLRSDMEAIERNLFGNMERFFEAAEDMTKGLFGMFGSPHSYDGQDSNFTIFGSPRLNDDTKPSSKRSVPIEPSTKPEARDGHVDISGLAREV